METQKLAAYPLTIFTDEFRWEGLLDIPAHRRLSDFVNDRELQFLELRDAEHALWDGENYRAVEPTGAHILLKANVTAIVSDASAPEPSADRAFDRVEKKPQPLAVYAPPFEFEGQFYAPPLLDWFAALKAARVEFLPLTNVTARHYRTGALVCENVPLVLVQLQRIIALGAANAAPEAS